MEEQSRAQELSVREISLIRELAQIRKEHKRELEYEKFDGYELPPRTQFSMLNKPAVSIKYGVMKFNMACIRLFEGIKYVLPILHPNKKRLALIMCPEEDSASVEWARQKGENWVNKDITSLEFVENIFRLMNWNRECRYKVLGRVANSDQGLCMLFDLEEAIMFTPKPQEYADPLTGEMKKKQMKFFPDASSLWRISPPSKPVCLHGRPGSSGCWMLSRAGKICTEPQLLRCFMCLWSSTA